jgi:hypothetical protein
VVESFVIFIAFGAGDRTQFQTPARSQIFTLAARLQLSYEQTDTDISFNSLDTVDFMFTDDKTKRATDFGLLKD